MLNIRKPASLFSNKPLSVTFIIAVIIIPLLVIIDPGGQIASVELKIIDKRYKVFTRQTESTKKVVFVTISDETLRYLEPLYGKWPWPRSIFGEVVDYIANDGAKAIVFDILFAQRTFNTSLNIEGLETLRAYAENSDIPEVRDELKQALEYLDPSLSDDFFVAAANDYGTVFQPALLFSDFQEDREEKGEYLARHFIQNRGKGIFPVFASIVTPFTDLMNASGGIGHVNFPIDSDGTLRRFYPFAGLEKENALIPSISVVTAAFVKGIDFRGIKVEKEKVIIGDATIPLMADGSAFIFYQGGEYKGENREVYQPFYDSFPLHHVLANIDLLSQGEEPVISEGLFRDKVVLIGATATGISNVRSTPLSSANPGIEIHANIIDNILENRFLKKTGAGYIIPYLFFLSFLMWLLTLFSGPYKSAMIYLSAITSLSVAHWTAFEYGTILPVAGPAFAMTGSYITGTIYRFSGAIMEKAYIKNIFRHYLSPSVLDEIIRRPEKLTLGGNIKYMTVLFSDIAGFTSISEKLPPDKLSVLLNEYLTQMDKCIRDTGGIVDKFVGDAVMAEWNAPADQRDHEAMACEAALLMLEELKQLRETWAKEGKPLLNIRIGINTGEMIVGNMGSNDIFDYTVLGNEVNTGARLEPLNKDFGTTIAVSENTYQGAVKTHPESYIFRILAKVVVKGRETPLQVYELYGRKNFANEETLQMIELYEKGISLYFEGNFEESGEYFKKALALYPGDGPSEKYLSLCEQYKTTPPSEEWKGLYIQESK